MKRAPIAWAVAGWAVAWFVVVVLYAGEAVEKVRRALR